ncbi:MAG: hypothetical protein SWZ49_18730 [Cyanobacteriota bacterium]|nr:hypothetical protein [Cyanobacteriota bacterium]
MSEPNKNNSQDLNNPEYWENLGIKPIVVDENDPNYIDKVTDQVTERIKEVVEQLKKEDKE